MSNQIINITLTKEQFPQWLAFEREKLAVKKSKHEQIERKLVVIDKKLEGLGAIVVRLTQLEADAAMAMAAREAKAIIDEVSASLNVFTPEP